MVNAISMANVRTNNLHNRGMHAIKPKAAKLAFGTAEPQEAAAAATVTVSSEKSAKAIKEMSASLNTGLDNIKSSLDTKLNNIKSSIDKAAQNIIEKKAENIPKEGGNKGLLIGATAGAALLGGIMGYLMANDKKEEY